MKIRIVDCGFCSGLIILLLILISFSALAQESIRYEKIFPGEKISYDVFYNWGLLWVHAGEAYFTTRKTNYKGKDAYHFYSQGVSFKKYDWIYKVRDTFETYVEKEKFRPLYFNRSTYEGGYQVDNQYWFDYEKNQIISSTYNSESNPQDSILPLQPNTFDVLSIIYHARNQDYDKVKVNGKIPIRVIIDGAVYDLYIRYLGRETIQTRDKKTYNCIKFSPLLVEGTIFSGGEDMTVWVSDDALRIPILIEAKILVGSIKTYLKKAEGLPFILREAD